MMKRFKVIAFLSFYLLMAINSYAQTTPNDLGLATIQAINDKDYKAFKKLIHPKSIEGLDQKKLREQIKRTLERSIIESYRVEITDISTNPYYNANIPAFTVGSNLEIFPVAPENLLAIYVTDGKSTKLHLLDAIGKFEGQWYIIWPTEERKK